MSDETTIPAVPAVDPAMGPATDAPVEPTMAPVDEMAPVDPTMIA